MFCDFYINYPELKTETFHQPCEELLDLADLEVSGRDGEVQTISRPKLVTFGLAVMMNQFGSFMKDKQFINTMLIIGYLMILYHNKNGKLDSVHQCYMGVSKNWGTPKWMVYNGKPN